MSSVSSLVNMVVQPPAIRRNHIANVMERNDTISKYDTDKSGGVVFRCVERGCGKLSAHAHCRRPYLIYRKETE